MNQEWYDNDIERYVKILEEKLIGYAKKRDLQEVVDLFQDKHFCYVLGLENFRTRFKDVMEYYEVWNQKALAVLLEQTQKLINEDTDVTNDLIELKQYCETKVKSENTEEEKTGLSLSDIKSFRFLAIAIIALIYLIRVMFQ